MKVQAPKGTIGQPSVDPAALDHAILICVRNKLIKQGNNKMFFQPSRNLVAIPTKEIICMYTMIPFKAMKYEIMKLTFLIKGNQQLRHKSL